MLRMRVQPQTLRTRLVIWFLVPSMFVWALGSWWVYETTLEASSSSYDYTLIATLETVSYRIRFDEGRVFIDFPTQIIPMLRERHVDRRFYQILGPNKEVVAGDANLPEPPAFPTEVKLYNSEINHIPVRVAAKRIVVTTNPLRECYIQIAETFTGRIFVAQEAADRLLLGGALMYILLLLFTGFAVRHGLAPLQLIQTELINLTLDQNRKLNEATAPEEVRPLIAAINDLMVRIRQELQRQKRFISNAAHQLRTPLAGLKVQAALALRDPNLKSISPTLAQIEKSLDNATHLINKMLTLASSEPGVIGEKQTGPVNLHELVRTVVKELAQRAVTKEIDLGIEEAPEVLTLIGVDWALKELVTNLVENALIYTPERGSVTVKTEVKNNTILLSVEDDGPGIPSDERERVFERFYRLPNAPKGGSGLGLSIVKEIAAAHRATLRISTPESGKGTKFTVEFPKLDRASMVLRI